MLTLFAVAKYNANASALGVKGGGKKWQKGEKGASTVTSFGNHFCFCSFVPNNTIARSRNRKRKRERGDKKREKKKKEEKIPRVLLGAGRPKTPTPRDQKKGKSGPRGEEGKGKKEEVPLSSVVAHPNPLEIK